MLATIESLFGRMFLLAGGTLMLFVRALASIRFRRGDRARILRQMTEFGVNSFPLATLIGFFTGLIIALNIGLPMMTYGQQGQIGTFMGLAMVREFGPVFTAFIIAARVGSAMTAELASMSVTEEVDSLRVMGLRPSQHLAMPRIVAGLVMNPLLTIYSTAAGLVGGMVLSTTVLGVSGQLYWDKVITGLDMHELSTGLTKAVVFGAVITSVCVYKGLATTGGARDVGQSTTRAVVISLTMILVADFIITSFMVTA